MEKETEKDKYEYTNIAKTIISREFQAMGDTKTSVIFRFLEQENEDDRAAIRSGILEMKDIFDKALKELEE